MLPLVVWADLDHPFSSPKIAILLLLGLVILGDKLFTARSQLLDLRLTWPIFAWLAIVSLATMHADQRNQLPLYVAIFPLSLFAFSLGQPTHRSSQLRTLFQILWFASIVVAIIALAQFFHADPFRLLGWSPQSFPSPRMRIYSTLGNPDFVAAWLAAALPIGWSALLKTSPVPRSLPLLLLNSIAILLVLSALITTGSRIAFLVLPVQALLFFLRSLQRHQTHRSPNQYLKFAPLLAILLLAASLPWWPQARSIQATIAGRLYLDRVTLSQWNSVPISGFGPGSYQVKFPDWQSHYLETHSQDAAFADPTHGYTEHAHNDALEFFVECGWSVPCFILACFLWCALRIAKRPTILHSDPWWAALAGLFTLLAIALVDFPLHRPAESALFWFYLGVVAAVNLNTGPSELKE